MSSKATNKEYSLIDTLNAELKKKDSSGRTYNDFMDTASKVNKTVFEVICEIDRVFTYNDLADIFSEAAGYPKAESLSGDILSVNTRFIQTSTGYYAWHPQVLDKLLMEQHVEKANLYLINKRLFDQRIGSANIQIVEDITKTREEILNIVKDALQLHATDIHIFPFSGVYKLTYRILGELTEISSLSYQYGKALCSAIMNYTKEFTPSLRIDETRRPQDGRILLSDGENIEADLRVSFVPKPNMKDTDIVIRLLRKESLEEITVESLGYSEKHCRMLRGAIQRSKGIIVFSGATGTGKSKSVNTLLSYIPTNRSVLTIEDPIEYSLPNGRQFQTFEYEDAEDHSVIRIGFPEFARAFKRHDPDVIFIGEVRDKETVETAIHLSKTGHLVFCTLHVSRATMIPEILINDFGMDINSISDNLVLGVNQVLVKTLCPKCKEEYLYNENPDWFSMLRFFNKTDVTSRLFNKPLFRSKGCTHCTIIKGNKVLSKGYADRTVVAEVFEFKSEDFAEGLISSYDFERRYSERGNVLTDGVNKTIAGEIDLDSLRKLL